MFRGVVSESRRMVLAPVRHRVFWLRYSHHKNNHKNKTHAVQHLSPELEKFRINEQDIIEPNWVEPKIDLSSFDLDNLVPLVKEEAVGLHVVEYKSKPPPIAENTPLVFLHGLFGSSLNFRSVGKVLSRTTRSASYGIDLRGHGLSPSEGPLSYLQMVDDVIETLEQHDLQGITLVGHSMGAKVAMLVALLRPLFVDKLVVVDNAPVAAPLDKRFYYGLVGLAEVERSNLDASANFKDYFHQADRILAKYEPSKLTRVFLLSNLVHDHESNKIRNPVMQFLKQDALKQVEQWPYEAVQGKVFTKPVKVMRGLESDFISEKNIQQDFPIYFPHAEYEDYTTGHWLISNQPNKFIESMQDFINK